MKIFQDKLQPAFGAINRTLATFFGAPKRFYPVVGADLAYAYHFIGDGKPVSDRIPPAN